MKNILIISEARPPQVNGVVTTLTNLEKGLIANGFNVDIIGPDAPEFKTLQLPFYKEILIVLNPWAIKKYIMNSKYDAIHIATEGPLGYYSAKFCEKKKIKFTTSYHTKMPEYVNAKFPFVPKSLVYAYMRSLHKNSSNVLVTSGSMEHELKQKGFKNKFSIWSRGVDSTIFNSSSKAKTVFRGPYILYVGRVSIEKNIEAFLSLNFPKHDKVVVGDGPDLHRLQKEYGDRDDIIFTGAQFGKDLASWYAGADCFVFPSKTDTYGIVMIESLCCGTPIAGYNVTGPMDVLTKPEFGEALDNLQYAVYMVLTNLNFYDCEKTAQEMFSWDKCVNIFINSLVAKQ